jgi:hypothetical protein
MKWLQLTPLFALLTSCIFTEGQIIEEPKDIVIPPSAYYFTPNYPCNSTDVTQAEKQTHHCRR